MYLSGTTMCRSKLRGVAHPQTPVAPAPRARTATDSGSRQYHASSAPVARSSPARASRSALG